MFSFLQHNRAVLLGAVDAAGIAATRRLGELVSDLTDDEVTAQLNPVVRRYILMVPSTQDTGAPVQARPRRAICQIGGSRVSRATARTAMY